MMVRQPRIGAFLATALAWALSTGVAAGQQPQPQSGTGAPPAAATAPDGPLVPAPAVRVEGNTKPTAGDRMVSSHHRENYRIGPGDQLDIRVLGEDKMDTITKVSEEGFIAFPFIDEDLRAQCLTERELGAVIAGKLKKYLKYPEVFVAVKEYNSTPVAIIGAVNAPGPFKMERQVSLLELVALAGGVKLESAGKILHIVHNPDIPICDSPAAPTGGGAAGDVTEVINIKRLMEGDVHENRVMRPGDIVVVPSADLVFVAGEVLKPNAYPLRDGMTLTQVLALAGGPSSVAKVSEIRVVRQEPGKPRQEIPIDLKAIQNNKAPDLALLANDVVEVPDSSGKKFFRGFISAIGGSAGQLPLRVIP
jgi:polysaccharide export outer membrane protein